MNLPCRPGLLLVLFLSVLPLSGMAQSEPDVPQQDKRFFFQFADRRDLLEKALNLVKPPQTHLPVGRSYALILGVTQYPNFPPAERSLRPAAVDIEKLKSYLRDQEFFDEIVVLKDGDFTRDNLSYFLESYFPARLKKSPHSRFLVAFSGHGYAEGSKDDAMGYLLTSSATALNDGINRISLTSLKTLLDTDIESAEKTLVLINSCNSGAFLGRKPYGYNPLDPGDRGAHAIMASRTNQESLHMDSVGPGSVFFEKIFAGLDGAADISPQDGIVTYDELVAYLRSEIPRVTDGSQIPLGGDISRNGSVGEFFFLNRRLQVQVGNSKTWNPGNALAFGMEAGDLFEDGQAAFRSGHYDEAFRAFRRSADAGNADGLDNLGLMYEQGKGVEQDYQQASRWYEKAAEAGSADGMSHLGYLYVLGHGVVKDYQQARQWIEKAAAANSEIGMFYLGLLYDRGLGVDHDYLKARHWYENAAATGDSDAMNNLGVLYEKTQDYQLASTWFEQAANIGNVGAMFNLGFQFENERDYSKARVWYQKAAMVGDALAMFRLGILFESGGHGIGRDYSQAYQWYQKAAAVGSKSAMNSLGNLYIEGHGVSPDYRQARQWYEKAAGAGSVDAMYNLGFLYSHGEGVTQDYQQARRWYEKAGTKSEKDEEDAVQRLVGAQSGSPELSLEVKQQIADEVKNQLALENQEVDPASSGIARLLSDGLLHVFVAGGNLDVTDTSGQECVVSDGDTLRLRETPPSDATFAILVVLSSKGSPECEIGRVVQVPLTDLQEMQNHMRETIDQGLMDLQSKQGTGGLPATPPSAAGPTTPATYAAVAPPPEPKVASDIQHLDKQGEQAERDVTAEAAQGASAKLANDITPAATPRTWAAATRVKLGLTSDQVQAVLGAPQMIVNMGPKVIYYYNGLEVTFKDGKVSDAQEMQSHMHGTIDKVLRRLQEEQGAESKR